MNLDKKQLYSLTFDLHGKAIAALLCIPNCHPISGHYHLLCEIIGRIGRSLSNNTDLHLVTYPRCT